MIKFLFKINEFPGDLSWDYALHAGVEGDMSIEINGVVVFEAEEFLFMELYFELQKWIESESDSNRGDFYFKSMDEEEEPIVAFVKDSSRDFYIFNSIWKKNEGRVKFDEIKSSFIEFKIDLTRQLSSRYNYFLE
jgi:hypothetical protein